MPLEDVTVSLSRLALAKAIKTPDGDEQEPWSKSVIFHQSHINQDMRNSILNPQSNGQARMRAHRHRHAKYPNQSQFPHQRPNQAMIRTRSNDRQSSSSSSSSHHKSKLSSLFPSFY
jgi:hypothetical protein